MNSALLVAARTRAESLQLEVTSYLRILLRNAAVRNEKTERPPAVVDGPNLVRAKVTLGMSAEERAAIESTIAPGVSFSAHLEALVARDLATGQKDLVVFGSATKDDR